MSIKILLAIDNKEIKERLDNKYGNRVYSYDIDTKENVIEFLSGKNEEYIVITKDTLNGNIDKKLYIKQLRLANSKSKIVYIVETLTKEYKEFLFANEVFNIIEGKNINFNVLVSYIDNPKDVVYKNIDNGEFDIKTKRIIGILGVGGVGKSLVSSVIANNISRFASDTTILVDMDTKNPSLDILNNLDSNKGLYQYFDNQYEEIENILIKKNNLAYLINKPIKKVNFSKDKLEKIYSFLFNNYTFSIIDLQSDIQNEFSKFWISRLTDLFVVVNPNFLNIRKSINYISKLKNKNICIILNNVKPSSISESQVKSLLDDCNIIGKVYYAKSIENCINGSVSAFEVNCDLYDLYKELNISGKTSVRNMYFEKYKKLKEEKWRI